MLNSPFAFMATYTTRLSAQARAQHVPLGQALREYAGAANRGKLLSLLLPVQRAAEHCKWLRQMIDADEIFHPLRGAAAKLGVAVLVGHLQLLTVWGRGGGLFRDSSDGRSSDTSGWPVGLAGRWA